MYIGQQGQAKKQYLKRLLMDVTTFLRVYSSSFFVQT